MPLYLFHETEQEPDGDAHTLVLSAYPFDHERHDDYRVEVDHTRDIVRVQAQKNLFGNILREGGAEVIVE